MRKNKLMLFLFACGLLLAAGCADPVTTINQNDLIWASFLNQGNEDCIFCHTGIDKVAISDIGTTSAQEQCLSCHSDVDAGNCLECHTGRNLPISENCLPATVQNCLKCHSDMRTGAGTFYDDCFLCHNKSLLPVSHHCVDSDLAGCLNCHSDMNKIILDPYLATIVSCDDCHAS